MLPEVYRLQSADTLLQLRDRMIAVTEQSVDISESLMLREPWDLFVVVLGAAHRAGHYLWDLSQIDTAGLSPQVLQALNNALVDIYRHCDQAVARLMKSAPQNAKILVFAVHGMGSHPGWSEYVPEILSVIQRKHEGSPAKEGLLYKLRRHLPWRVVNAISEHMPQEFLHWLVSVYSTKMFNWKSTRYFPLPSPLYGCLRINLKGREPEGIVEPGEEYDEICTLLAQAFMSFRDIETGKPIVERVYGVDDLSPEDAPRRERLPDLFITWADIPAKDCKGIRSEEYGDITWSSGGKLPSGRSGNHVDKGWFVAAGDGIPAGIRADGYRTVDLVSTIFEWLGAEWPKNLQGTPISLVCNKEDTHLPETRD